MKRLQSAAAAHMRDAVLATPVVKEPFAHLIIADLYPNDIYDQIMERWPDLSLFHRSNSQTRFEFNFHTSHSKLPKAELETAWCEVKCHRLGEKSDDDGSNAISVWAGLSRKDKRNPLLLEAYCRRLMDTSKEPLAEKILRKRLTRQWEKNLVQLYGLIRTNEPLEQIQVAEGWMRTHSEDPDLLIALARLYLHVGNKDRSRSLLTEASRYGGGEESHFELGLLLEAAGEGDSALQAYRRGMERSNHELPSLTKLPIGEILPLASESHEPK